MDFRLTTEQEMLKSSVRRFMERRVAPIVADHEQREEFAWDLLPELTEFGYIGGLLPESMGGYGMAYTDYAAY
ncbi:acyl-CoA dehydrogenase family protein [Mesorhizobium sp. J428]|uniref:acyl-CoA dehydrogenase family protein n=1 Tax=Mesorhizobium sp. J428 TaxID=2898440 RepID=UPI0021518522|nr:acyl-CoA dehydrogenase family protein [Mesorhizobium sp. J428]